MPPAPPGRPVVVRRALQSDGMSSPGPTPTTWEYLTAPVLIHSTKAILDNFGRDGWELVTVTAGATGEQPVAWFKRPKNG